MTDHKPYRAISAVVLVLSLGANAYLLLSAPADPDADDDAGARTRAASGRGSGATSAEAGACPPCADQTGQQLRMFQMLLSRSLERPAADAGATAGYDPPRPRRISDEGSRREALFRVGQVAARNDWQEKRGELVESVRDSLADTERQEREMLGDVERFADALDLDESQEQLFEERYRETRRQRMDEVLRAVSADEPDFVGAFEALRGLYADEDQLIEDLFGEETRERLHDHEIDKRATILAIAATYAGLDWETSIRW